MLGKRTLSTIALAAVILLVLFGLPSVVGVALLIVIAVAGLLEFYGILNLAGVPAFRIMGSVAGVVLLLATYLTLTAPVLLPGLPAAARAEFRLLAMFLIVFAVCIRQFPQKNNPQPLPTIACTIFGIMYVPFLLSCLLALALTWEPVLPFERMGKTAQMLILYLLIVVKIADTGAFLVGSRFGRHKLFPRISPGKTWEGLLGGLAAGTLASVVFFWAMPAANASRSVAAFGVLPMHRVDAWVVGFLMSGVGVLGDLVESLLKRAAGLKDSGRAMPGLGGVLDVLDSLLFAGPALYFYAHWVMGP